MSLQWLPPPDPLPAPRPPRPEEWPSAGDGLRLTTLGPNGRYVLNGIHATGGQALLWRATDTLDGNRGVVIKTVRENNGGIAQLVSRRLEREGRMLHLLRDRDDVMPLLDQGPETLSGELPETDPATIAEYAWLVLPERPHRLLHGVMDQRGALGVDAGREVAQLLAAAVQGLHDRNVVHRDVTPGNVLFVDGEIVLADFGAAWCEKWADEDNAEHVMSELTGAIGRPGTEGWFPPDLLRARTADSAVQDIERSPALDVYSWGLYAAAAVTGRHPWSRHGPDRVAVFLSDDPVELGRFHRGAPPHLDLAAEIGDPCLAELVQAALAENPADRPSATEIVQALATGQLPRRGRDNGSAGTPAPLSSAPQPPGAPWGSGGSVPAEAVNRLAAAVRTQWEDESEIRRLNDPHPLPVAWDPAPESLVDSWPAIARVARTGTGGRSDLAESPEPDLSGRDNELADILVRRVLTRRLVVLGRPGAGKTMLLVRLVLDLLARRGDVDGRVPVLVSLASWNPDGEGLRDWLRRVILRDHPWLRTREMGDVRGERLVDRLLDEHRLLPVLDGLDEIPDRSRPFAIEAINKWLSRAVANQLVISCRLDEYESMVTPSPDSEDADRPVHVKLRGGAGVVLRELDAADVTDYLTEDAGSVEATERWEPVLRLLGTGAPVDLALRTPLMVGLARTIYNPRVGERAPTTGPGELCRTDVFPDRESIMLHLFDGFIPAAYREHPDKSRRCPWSATHAERWLRNLAHHLGDPATATTPANGPVGRAPLGKTDLAWWELRASVSPWLIGMLAAVVPAVAVGLAALAGPRLGMGLGIGLLVGVITAAFLRNWPGPAVTAKLTARWRGGPVAGIAVGAAFAVLGAMAGGALGQLVGLGNGWAGGLVGAVGVGLGVGPVGGLAASVVGGLAGGVSVGLTAGVGPGLPAGILCGLGAGVAVAVILVFSGRNDPARGLDRFGFAIVPGLGAGIVAGVGLGITAGPVAGVAGALAGFFLGLRNPEADLRAATDPATSLARDRTTFVALGLVPGILVTLGAGLAVHPAVGVAGGITVGLVFGFLQAAWGRYLLARCVLALRGQVPWRLMTFLTDAHRERGVLRQVGAYYQFRHADLQRRLTERP